MNSAISQGFTPTSHRYGLTGYSGFLIDMDGILQAYSSRIPGAANIIHTLLLERVPFAVITNECRLTNQQLSEKLVPLLGGARIPPNLFYTAANSVAYFLKKWTPKGKRLRVVVVGEVGLLTAVGEVAEVVTTVATAAAPPKAPVGSGVFSAAAPQSPTAGASRAEAGATSSGVPHAAGYDAEGATAGDAGASDVGSSASFHVSIAVGNAVTHDASVSTFIAATAAAGCKDEPVDYVIIGALYSDQTPALEAALDAVRNGAKLLYTCPDAYEVDGQGRLRLGMPLPAVKLIGNVTGALGFCCGKPNANMARQGLKLIGLLHDELAKVLFVGDSLDTDVRLAMENGLDSALVLSAGAVSKEKLRKSCFKPNFVFDSVAEFADILPGLLQVNKAGVTASTIPE
jgi:ribonucleotide monophosphatase NagD (HAD superfamily)